MYISITMYVCSRCDLQLQYPQANPPIPIHTLTHKGILCMYARLRRDGVGSTAFNTHKLIHPPPLTHTHTHAPQSLSDIGVGPGPTFECVRFSTLGRSPLLQHYLYTHNLSEVKVHTGHPISRTQVKDIPQPSTTYKELLHNSTVRSDQWYKAYER